MHASSSRYTNRLADETSPYLRQHAHNPVNWYPWGEEALAKARTEDKPIFLSIGYAACHWCHVMERESFENEAIAAMLNRHFVSIKVDREERPDLDEIYMSAVVALTGQGGWPMSVFLTMDLKPFYGGTYFPPVDMWGRPGFGSILNGVAQAWAGRRDEIAASAEGLTAHIENQLRGVAASAPLGKEIVARAANDLKVTYDKTWGGWGSAPKFPSSASIMLLLREYSRTNEQALLDMATHTLDKMFQGGMYDHLGGGFARYSVDAEWLVPHFEKMLYDNAQLAEAYLEAYQVTGEARYRRVVEEIFEYVMRDLRAPGGAFFSSEDADSEGEEGKFYIWRRAEMDEVLGEKDAELFARYYNIAQKGNFSSHESYHAGLNILHLLHPARTLAQEMGITEEDLERRMAPLRGKMLARRSMRVRPGLDDKILTSWNALMVSALAKAAAVLGNETYEAAAVGAAKFVLQNMRKLGDLLRTHRDGVSHLPAYLEDYSTFANACVDLYQLTFDKHWLDTARDIVQRMNDQFWDEEAALYTATGPRHSNILVRTRPTYDGAEPSGNSMAAMALLRLGRLLDKREYLERAERILQATSALMEQAPRGYLRMILAADFYLAAPMEVVLAGSKDDAAGAALLKHVHAQFLPNAVFAQTPGGQDDLPILQGKSLVDGKPALFVCQNYACDSPITDPEALRQKLLTLR